MHRCPVGESVAKPPDEAGDAACARDARRARVENGLEEAHDQKGRDGHGVGDQDPDMVHLREGEPVIFCSLRRLRSNRTSGGVEPFGGGRQYLAKGS